MPGLTCARESAGRVMKPWCGWGGREAVGDRRRTPWVEETMWVAAVAHCFELTGRRYARVMSVR